MPSYRDAYKVPLGVIPDDPPPGSVGHDPDGAMLFFGCKPWIAAYEGQQPGQPPTPATASRQDPSRCETCGAVVGADYRRMSGQTCAGCLRNDKLDGRLMGEIIRDIRRARKRADRKTTERGSLNYAQKKHGKS